MKETKQSLFYVGPNVEHSPAYSKKTLFVVGKQDLNKIVELAREHKVTHIFMGANHSFDVDLADRSSYWDNTVQGLLDRGFWVTLDYPAHRHETVLKMLNKTIWISRMFVPMLNVRIPQIQSSNLNLTVKIDDVPGTKTNPGVWCMNWHEITDSNRFTDWQEYTTDVVIKDDEVKIEPKPIAQPEIKSKESDIVVETPALKLADVDIKNDENLGLDPNSKSMLKGETVEILETLNMTALDAAEAYAEGAKSDPLSKSTLSLKKGKK